MSNHTFSSDESNVSDSFDNLKSTFRVRVNLQHYFDDVRARCYILVSRKRRVRWLQERLRKVFSLPGALCLCANGHLLPPTEPLGLLCPEDRVEVIPLQDGQFKYRSVDNALVLKISKEKDNAKASTPSALLSDCPDMADNSITLDRSHFDNFDKKDMTTNIEISGRDYLDGVTETTEDETSEHNIGSLDSCWNTSANTDLHLDEPNILQKYKQDALALLESQCGSQARDDSVVSEDTMPKRARRRLRRRTRRRAASRSPELAVAAPCTGAVARNDAASARRPRLVQALDTVDFKLD